jgi:hypothetical protein
MDADSVVDHPGAMDYEGRVIPITASEDNDLCVKISYSALRGEVSCRIL